MKAINLCKKLEPNNQSNLPISYSNLGLLYSHQRKFESAISLLDLSIAQGYGNNWRAYKELGVCYQRLGEYHKANSYFQKALDICIENFGDSNINTLYTYLDMGTYYYESKQYIAEN